jgi:hypothetical protein
MYIFYPFFHYGLYLKAANITDNLCNKQGNSSKKIRGLQSRAGYNGGHTVNDNLVKGFKKRLHKSFIAVMQKAFGLQ